MKFWLGLIFFFFVYGVCFARDSSQQALPPSKQKSLKAYIDYTNDVVYDIYLTSPDSARNMAEKALILSEKIKYPLGIGRSYSNIGVIYWSQSYYPIALFYLNKALEKLPKDHPLDISDVYSNIGRVYADLNNYKAALYDLNKARLYAGKDTLHLGEVFSELSYVYMKQKNYARAIKLSMLALKYDKVVNEQSGAAIIYSRLGSIYYFEKDYTQALFYDDIAFRESKRLNINRLMAGMYIEYATIYNNLHRYDDAIKCSDSGIVKADSIGTMDVVTLGYRQLIRSYEGKNDLKRALINEREYNKIQDSLNTVDKLKSTQLIQNYFELNSRLNNMDAVEKKNLDNKSKIKFQDTIIDMLAVSLFIVIGALSVTYYYYKQKRVLSNQLKEQHRELFNQKQLIESQAANLEQVNAFKDKMLAIVGHDLRTPMANLHNILELFQSGYLAPNEVHILMRDINPVVKGAELTLSNLLEWAGSQVKGRPVSLTNVDIFLLGAEMEQTFKYLLKSKNIKFINMVQPGQVVLADENHIKVILRNLISNAIKFTDNNGQITLLAKAEADKLVIAVEDTGKGMSSAEIEKLFYLDTHFSGFGTLGEKGTGLGLILCKELVELNGGKLTVISEEGKGSKFYFDLTLVK